MYRMLCEYVERVDGCFFPSRLPAGFGVLWIRYFTMSHISILYTMYGERIGVVYGAVAGR